MKLKATLFLGEEAQPNQIVQPVDVTILAVTKLMGFAPEEGIQQAIENGRTDPYGVTNFEFTPDRPMVWVDPRLVQVEMIRGNPDPVLAAKRTAYIVTEPVVDPTEFGMTEVDELEELFKL